MKPVKIKENVYWVGGVDWDLRNFHGYLTQRGSTYNSYLIIDEKITLIDGVKHYLFPELIERISEIVDPAKIDYIIHNHVEMDHSGSLPKMLEVAKNAQIIASPNGEKGLKAHYGNDLDVKVVKTGDTLNIGKRELCFVLTPMVHWPDNMVTWSPEDKILFSNDAFGQHIASSVHFDDEYPMNTLFDEAQKYYANIVLPYGAQVQKAMTTVKELQPEVIAPSHGLIWRKYIPEIINKYDKWASNNADEKAVIIYDTMWGSTQKIAHAIADGFEHSNVPFQMFNLQYNHISDIMTELVEAKYICVGSPTLNNNILPTNASFLTYLKGLAPKNRVALAFGSFGWGGQSIGLVREDLEKCKFKMWDDIKYQYIPPQNFLEDVTDRIINNLKEEKE